MYQQLKIKTAEHLAHRLRVPLALIDRVLAEKELHYHPGLQVTKPGKEPRPVVRLSEVAKSILHSLNDLLHVGLGHPPYMHGGMRGKTIKTNARPHVRAPFLLKLDIRKFFPSVSREMVIVALMKHAGLSPPVAQLVADLATHEDKLITGSPASTVIASLVIREGTERVDGLVRQRGGRFSIFVDDVTISGGRHLAAIEETCVCWIEETGVKVHPGKRIRTSGQEATKVVTGVDVSHGIDAPRGFRRNIQDVCSRLDARSKRGQHPTDRERASLRGKLNHLKHLNPGMAMLYLRRYHHLLQAETRPEMPPGSAQQAGSST